MSVQVADINTSGFVAGTTGTIPPAGSPPLPVAPVGIAQQMRPDPDQLPHVVIFNDSGCRLLLSFTNTVQTKTLPAGRWINLPLPPGEVRINYTVSAVATGIFNSLSADYYAPGEPVDDLGVVGNSPIGATLSIPTQIQNLGVNASQDMIEGSFDSAPLLNDRMTNRGDLVIRPEIGANSLTQGFAQIAILGTGQSDGPLAGPLVRFGDVTNSASSATGLQPFAGVPTFQGVYNLISTATGGLAGAVNGGVTYGQAGALGGGTPPDSTTYALFNGTTGWIACPADTALPTSGSITIECLCKISANPGANAVLLLLGNFNTNTAMYFLMDTGGHVTVGNDNVSVPVSGALALNAYHHLAATYDGTNLRCYVDGTLTGGPTAATVTPAYSGAANRGVGLSIGQIGNGLDFFPGILGEVAVYASALSAARISAHFGAIASGGYAFQVLSDSPLRYYRLGDAFGSGSAAATNAQAVQAFINAGGGFSAIGGQATAGGLGAPVIVAVALDVPITTASLTTVLSYTPTVTGLYRIGLYATVRISATGTVFAIIKWTDPLGTAQSTNPADTSFGASGGAALINGVALPNNSSVPTMPVVIEAKAGVAITVQWSESGTSPNDVVSAVIERLT